mmetsp:Transcript_132857/g.384120  ORF Transcript_132857/g.384120 Transcript_132857/m.384120 type:complete len:247 (-) Transcript_132857:708-1448(-)
MQTNLPGKSGSNGAAATDVGRHAYKLEGSRTARTMSPWYHKARKMMATAANLNPVAQLCSVATSHSFCITNNMKKVNTVLVNACASKHQAPAPATAQERTKTTFLILYVPSVTSQPAEDNARTQRKYMVWPHKAMPSAKGRATIHLSAPLNRKETQTVTDIAKETSAQQSSHACTFGRIHLLDWFQDNKLQIRMYAAPTAQTPRRELRSANAAVPETIPCIAAPTAAVTKWSRSGFAATPFSFSCR